MRPLRRCLRKFSSASLMEDFLSATGHELFPRHGIGPSSLGEYRWHHASSRNCEVKQLPSQFAPLTPEPYLAGQVKFSIGTLKYQMHFQ